MVIHHARRHARFDAGELVLLADQDRSLWDEEAIVAGRSLLDHAIAMRGGGGGGGGGGQYVLQAAIASLQTEEPIDWAQIAALYRRLGELTDSPVVELNRAVAVGESGAPAQALEIVERLDLDDYRYLHSTRAELLRRLGRTEDARAAYARALEQATTEPERRFLQRRLAEL
jgi:RNA polymerase sigma-70 factor (ECF subfamily)